MKCIYSKAVKDMLINLWKYNKRHYEVIVSFPSPYRGLDELEVHKFDSLKSSMSFCLSIK